jgi:translation initiation factor IF-3
LAEKFLQKGDKVKIRLQLRGREKSHQDIAIEKIETFIKLVQGLTAIKIERELKKEPGCITIIISKQ